jgi:Domain of unknown function (DUF3885)
MTRGWDELRAVSLARETTEPAERVARFLAEHFPGLVLAPPLVERWPVALRLELGEGLKGVGRVERAADRAAEVYESAFGPGDEALVVGWLWPPFDVDVLGLFESVPGDAPVSFGPERLHTLGEDEEAEVPLLQAVLATAARLLDHRRLLRGVANRELGLDPALVWEVYVLNESRPLVFHMYDDRGLDVVAASEQTLHPLRRQFGAWLAPAAEGQRA